MWGCRTQRQGEEVGSVRRWEECEEVGGWGGGEHEELPGKWAALVPFVPGMAWLTLRHA